MIGEITLLIVLANLIVSYKGFQDEAFREKYLFDIDAILIHKEYVRLVSSGFLHANWLHLIFNMIALYSFSTLVEYVLGIRNYLIIYFGSLITGNLLALFFHCNDGEYRALGASGAVNGVIFSCIAIAPDSQIRLILLPFAFPAWFIGIVSILVAMYGIKSRFGNIGHSAHLGGAVAGILLSIALEPAIFEANTWIIVALLLPFVLFMAVVIRRPESMLIDNYVEYERRRFSEYQLVEQEIQEERDLNRLLEKVNKNGLHSLSKRERKYLDTLSGKL